MDWEKVIHLAFLQFYLLLSLLEISLGEETTLSVLVPECCWQEISGRRQTGHSSWELRTINMVLQYHKDIKSGDRFWLRNKPLLKS